MSHPPKTVVIFPSKNEEDAMEYVTVTAKNSHQNPEIIVVDAYYYDATVSKG